MPVAFDGAMDYLDAPRNEIILLVEAGAPELKEKPFEEKPDPNAGELPFWTWFIPNPCPEERRLTIKERGHSCPPWFTRMATGWQECRRSIRRLWDWRCLLSLELLVITCIIFLIPYDKGNG